MRARLMVSAALLVGGLAAVPVLPAPPAGAAVTSTRLSGTNRFETAAAMAKAKFPNGVASVVLASGFTFADALAGSYFAGAGTAACPESGILLTTPDTLPPATQQALADLHVKTVTILGGTSAVSDNVAGQLQALGLTVKRIGGHNRFETMLDLDTACGAPTQKVAFIASGLNFPDALSAAGASYGKHIPMILTRPDQLSAEARQALTTLGITQVLVMGGASAVSPAVNSAITGMGIAIAQQFAGHDRGDTAAKFATWAVANLGFSKAEAALARGDDFADALAGAQATGDPVVTLLTDGPNNLWPATVNYLLGNAAFLQALLILGGTTAITPANVANATSAANGQAPASLSIASFTPSIMSMTDQAPFTIAGTFPFDDASQIRVSLLPSSDNPNLPVSDGPCAEGGSTMHPIVPQFPADVTAVSASTIKGTLTVPDLCPPGPYDVAVFLSTNQTASTIKPHAVTLQADVRGVSPNAVPNDAADHQLRISGRGFVEGLTAYVSPSASNTTAPTGPCENSTNTVDVALSHVEWAFADGLLALPAGCPTGQWDVFVDETANGIQGGLDACLGCLNVPAATPAGPRTLSMNPTQPVFGHTVTVTYAGGVDPRGSDSIQARSPSGFHFNCGPNNIQGSGTCNIDMPSQDASGGWVLAWSWTGVDGRSNPCGTGLTFQPGTSSAPPECDLAFTMP